VNKRINAKFYYGDKLEKGMTNPPPGTLVYNTVTDSDRDFYLISQKAT